MNRKTMRSFLAVAAAMFATCAAGAGKSAAKPSAAVAFTNELAVVEFNVEGQMSKLADRATGRDLLRYRMAASMLKLKGGTGVGPESLAWRDGRMVFTWAGRKGTAELSVRNEKWGFVFTVEKADIAAGGDVAEFVPMRLCPAKALGEWVGTMACCFADPENAVALRAYELETSMAVLGRNMLETSVAGRFSPVGRRVALVAAPYAKMRDCLKAMTLDAGVFHTPCGGAWSLDAPENRQSYLFAGVTHDSVDDWIALAERGGFGKLHFTGWWKTKGHYAPSPTRFPGGIQQLRACVDKVRAAGLSAGTHTLTSGIDFSDPWITPVCRTNLHALYTYTLAQPLEPDAGELVVEEQPGPRHHTATTYLSNGNILRLGGELVTYSGIRREKPYAFTGIKRGAFGTLRPGTVPAGVKVDYVFQHFFNLFPAPRSDFADEMARHVGGIVRDCGFSLVYHDGAEPFPRYDADLNRLKFARAAAEGNPRIQFEASMGNPHGWWYHSVAGALDHPTWAAKRYHDVHVKSAVQSVRGNFLACQTGWWSPRMANGMARGHFPDEIEYFASKNAANDLSMSVQGPSVSKAPLSFSHEDQMTILGWYERARLARVFTPEAVALMRCSGAETRLRQGDDGTWMIRGVKCVAHRVASDAFRRWTHVADEASRASLRVEALYGAEPFDAASGRDLIGADDLGDMKFATAGKDVAQDVEAVDAAGIGRVLRISAENRRAAARGAWTRLSLEYANPFRDASVPGNTGGAFGFWVKGDGSGALLNLQVQSSRIHVGGISDHVVKLDFNGWRYVLLFARERDVDAWLDHAWPYSGFYQIFRQQLDLKRIEKVSVYLNEIPANGRTVVEMSQVRVLPTKKLTLREVKVSANGSESAVPFDLESGERAELDGGFWTRYSERGDPLARRPANGMPLLAGGNRFAFSAKAYGGEPRAEVTVFELGEPVAAFSQDAAQSPQMAYEAMRPQWFEPAGGFDATEAIRSSPGRSARLEVELLGRVRRPSLRFPGGKTFTFDVDMSEGHRLVCRDGRNWRVLDEGRSVVKEGRLAEPMPALDSGAVAFSADTNAAVRVSVVKRYAGGRASAGKAVPDSAQPVSNGDAPSREAAETARATLRAWTFDEGSGAFSREVAGRDWDVVLSPLVRWATGPFGTALAFTEQKAYAYVPRLELGDDEAWTVTAWVRPAAGNKAVVPWTLRGTRLAGGMKPEHWTLFAVGGRGSIPVFRMGSDGENPFFGLLDDLRICNRRLSADELDRLASNPAYMDIDGWQDDGTGGVAPITLSPPCQVEASGQAALPGEDSRKPAISPFPFPDAISAYVWRNWGLVPVQTLARVVDATPKDLAEIASEMGLPRMPAVPPQWRRKGYITVVRRNWHLLPYDQLLPLLGMTREEFRFALMEDDFLWIKLGRVKPKCERLRWTAEAARKGRAARLRLAAVLAEEGLAADAPEEPRFAFMEELAAKRAEPAARQGGVPGKSPFGFRMIFSYFADYGDPLADPDVGSFPEGLLQKLSAEGVNAVWLHTVLGTLVADSRYPEFGRGGERRLANLRTLVARAARHGIKVYLYMNEPRAQPAEFFAADASRAEIKGTWDLNMPMRFTMCTSTPEVRRWLGDSLEKVFRDVPGLGGIFTITRSENLTNCASHEGQARCPRCRNRTCAEIVAEVNRAMIEGMARGNPSAEALVWDWNWPKGEEKAIVDGLPRANCRLMSVSENGIEVERGGVRTKETDYSMSIVGPGENARRLWSFGKERGIPCVAKVQAGNSWELSSFPYIPVMDLVAEHAANLVSEGVDGVMLSWSLGCCPSPNLSVYRDIRPGPSAKDAVLEAIARRLYGEKAPQARKAWRAFSDGFRNYPFTVWTIYLGPQQWGPANPLYPSPTGYSATMVGIPYDDLAGWRSKYPAGTYAELFGKVADGFEEGCRLMEGVAPRREVDLYRAEQMHFASCRDQALFVIARDSGDGPAMLAAARRELERAKAYWPIVRADSRIGYESSNHYFFTPRDVLEKILSCRAIIDRKYAEGYRAEFIRLVETAELFVRE